MSHALVHLYQPHPAQQALHRSRARFRVAPCGRRFGKTMACLNDALLYMLNRPGSVCWWVAPTYRQSEIAYEMLIRAIDQPVMAGNLRTRHRVTLGNGSIFEFKTGEKPDNLRGEGLDFLVMDECAIMSRSVWEECLRPALADRRGKAIFIGTPKGRNWFYEIFQRGLDKDQAEWDSFTFPSWANPISFPQGKKDAEIGNLRQAMPANLFRQEIAAEFLPDSAGVFRHINDCLFGQSLDDEQLPIKIADPVPEHDYVAGLDLARLTDFSVLVVFDRREKRLVYFDRFNQIDWAFQISRIVPVIKAYNDADLVVDKTGVGDAIEQELSRAGLWVEGIGFTASRKAQLVQALAVSIEQQEIAFPKIPVLIRELEMFGYQMLPSGNVRYAAPEGHHDDCVIALALANWKLRRQVGWRDFPQIESPILEGQVIERS